MFEIGRVCVKIAGRDAGAVCVVIEKQDDTFVVIDGQSRRRKCNVAHLEPTKDVVKIKEKASSDEVAKALEAIGVTIAPKGKARKAADRPKRAKVRKVKPVKEKPKQAAPKKSKSEGAKASKNPADAAGAKETEENKE